MAMTEPKIVNRGRGPEIAGTRITVYDVMDYRKLGWHRDRIAVLFRLGSADIQAAFDYMDAHQEEVEVRYAKMLARAENPEYPADVKEKLEATKGVARRKTAEIRRGAGRITPS
jgi:uncharacterized protein (DUF433 family)